MDTEGVEWPKETMEMLEWSRKAALFDWLMYQMRGGWETADGKQWWNLPVGLLQEYRTKTPQEAVEAAYKQYMAWR